ncbi:hypothetical protein [Methanococcoides methylutens]|uniref:hypothetical protein n=1 Tax=Methanococcoides methylutens TaxID=2226 RepID=UPI0012E0AEF1|nr:hypothetical protein [Methanococcoides methylutens]
MGIKDEILTEFFEKMEKEESIPKITVKSIKELYTSNSLNSKNNIFDAIEKGAKNGNKN